MKLITCKRSVHLLSQPENRTWTQALLLKWHLLICHHCRKYARQIQSLPKIFRRLWQSRGENLTPEMVKKVEDKVLSQVDRKK